MGFQDINLKHHINNSEQQSADAEYRKSLGQNLPVPLNVKAINDRLQKEHDDWVNSRVGEREKFLDQNHQEGGDRDPEFVPLKDAWKIAPTTHLEPVAKQQKLDDPGKYEGHNFTQWRHYTRNK